MATREHFRVKALVVGNDEYQHIDTLSCAVNDAKSIADAFRKLKFYVSDYYNAKYVDWAHTIGEFVSDLGMYDVAIFYFAGHGFEIDGSNYLVYVDTPFSQEGDIEVARRETLYFSVELQNVINDILEKNCKVNIFILDACRKDPFAGNARSGFATVNLAPVFAPKGSLIAYSTSPGQKALENVEQGHGYYTNAFLQYVFDLGLPVEDFFKKVRTSVYNLSGKRQTSWEHTSLIGKFSFNSGQAIQNISAGYPDKYVVYEDYDYSDVNIKEILELFASTQFADHEKGLAKMKSLAIKDLSDNQMFLLGRWCLRAAIYGCFKCQDFIVDTLQLSKYTIGGKNHFVNGMLFDLYFNDKGQFEPEFLNIDYLSKLLRLRHCPDLRCPFEYISSVLRYFSNVIMFIPNVEPQKVSFDIMVREGKYKYGWIEEKELDCYYIESFIHDTTDILMDIQKHKWLDEEAHFTEKSLIQFISNCYKIPLEFIDFHFNKELDKRKIVISLKANEDI